MSSRTLYRWSGIVLIAGSLIGIIGTILDTLLFPDLSQTPQQILSASFALDAALFLAWSLLVTLGLFGFYLRQAERAGRLGFAGFVLTTVGMLIGGVGFALVQVTVFPYLAESAPALLPSGDTGPALGFVLWILAPGVLLALGNVLLGIATRRALVFPRWTGVLLIIAGIAFLLSIPPIPSSLGNITDLVTNSTMFVALAWSGYLLMKQEHEPIQARTHPAIEANVSR